MSLLDVATRSVFVTERRGAVCVCVASFVLWRTGIRCQPGSGCPAGTSLRGAIVVCHVVLLRTHRTTRIPVDKFTHNFMPGHRNISTTASDNCRAQVSDKRNALFGDALNRTEFCYIVRKPVIGIAIPKVPFGVDRPPGST